MREVQSVISLFVFMLYASEEGSIGAAMSTELKLFTTYINWNDAQAHCFSLGMTLAFLDSESNAFVTGEMPKNYFKNAVGNDFWIGIFDSDQSDSSQSLAGYSWSDSCRTLEGSWTSWGSDEPQNTVDSFCVAMEKDQPTWRSFACSEEKPFLCGRKIPGSNCNPGNCVTLDIDQTYVQSSGYSGDAPQLTCPPPTTTPSTVAVSTVTTVAVTTLGTTESTETLTSAATTQTTTEDTETTEVSTSNIIPTTQTTTEDTETTEVSTSNIIPTTQTTTEDTETTEVSTSNVIPTTQTTTEDTETTKVLTSSERTTQTDTTLVYSETTTQNISPSGSSTNQTFTENNFASTRGTAETSVSRVTTQSATEVVDTTVNSQRNETTTLTETTATVAAGSQTITTTWSPMNESSARAEDTSTTAETSTMSGTVFLTQTVSARNQNANSTLQNEPNIITTPENVQNTRSTEQGRVDATTGSDNVQATTTALWEGPVTSNAIGGIGTSTGSTREQGNSTQAMNEEQSSSTPSTSTSTPSGSTPQSNTSCCTCIRVSTVSKAEEDIKQNLTLDPLTLSSTRRRRESAPDSRLSSRVIGSGGLFLVFGAFLVLFVTDFVKIYKDLRFGVYPRVSAVPVPLTENVEDEEMKGTTRRPMPVT